MSTTTTEKTHAFQAEVKQLLHLMIHSLYSNKEIFLRELISNAADACDKLRFEAIKTPELLANDPDLGISITLDDKEGVIKIEDNGIGMSRDEVVSNLGTIARSGTREFLDQMSGDEKRDAALIGQFGVGFYSAFIVAHTVEVDTLRAGEKEAVSWRSQGDGEYTLDDGERTQRGTTITLHLRDDDKSFSERERIRYTVQKYSDHIAVPVKLIGEGENGETTVDTVNQSSALWRRAKSDITQEQYDEFYTYVSNDSDAPLAHSHNRVEGKTEYSSLLYVPSRRTFDLWDREKARGVKLFVKRVFIMDDAQAMLPNYLRFVRGVIDADDLPLNVSREILQSDRTVESIRAGSTKKVLGMLSKLAKDEEKYQTFWDAFGVVLKEGIMEDHGNAEALAKLMRFATTASGDDAQTVSLAAYVERQSDKDAPIYYLLADSVSAGSKSPHLEGLIAKGHEVIILTEPLDEWVVAHLTEFDGKSLKNAAHGEAEETPDEETKEDDLDEQYRDMSAKMASLLKEQVSDVRVSRRLVNSASCLVAPQGELGDHVKRMLREAGHEVPPDQKALEINPTHPLVIRLANLDDKDQFKAWSMLVYEQAILAAGGQLDDPTAFLQRVNEAILGADTAS
ncbi:MAG: molecular chaperone HtpG [Gammaproteobacteria bacterium]